MLGLRRGLVCAGSKGQRPSISKYISDPKSQIQCPEPIAKVLDPRAKRQERVQSLYPVPKEEHQSPRGQGDSFSPPPVLKVFGPRNPKGIGSQ